MIVLCRHGATDANAGGAFLSKNDPPLNAIGRAQSRRARVALHHTHFAVTPCSPMLRCIQTLEIVAPYAAPIACDELREIDFGSWDGRTLEWIERHDPEGLARRRADPVRFRPPGGESFLDVADRLLPFAQRTRARAGDGVLVVAHRGSLGVLERLLRDVALDSRDVPPLEPGEYRIVLS
ncbi:MAG TPA: histidine phosphatase family protein [Candidatus Tumulicola sp.]